MAMAGIRDIRLARRHGAVGTARRRPRGGFTLAEVLLVVVILGILAAVVIPQFGDMISDVRDRVLDINKSQINRAVAAYYTDHGAFPDASRFHKQLTMASDKKGETDGLTEEGAIFGPYLPAIPPNPYTNNNTVGNGAPGSSDWFYNELTGTVDSNYVAPTLSEDSVQNMRTLLAAARQYATDTGRFPGSLTDLQGTYLSAEKFQKVMANPVTGENPGYVFTGGGMMVGDIPDASQTPVMYESWGGSPNYSGVIGYADGRVSIP